MIRPICFYSKDEYADKARQLIGEQDANSFLSECEGVFSHRNFRFEIFDQIPTPKGYWARPSQYKDEFGVFQVFHHNKMVWSGREITRVSAMLEMTPKM